MRPDHSLEDAQEQAALYALGALRGEDAQVFEAHLASGCEICAAEVRTFNAVTAELGRAARPQTPPAAARACVLVQATEASGATVTENAGVRIVRSAGLQWNAGNAPAVEIKTLHVDGERGYSTKLVRMAPGATLIAHRHTDVEESYVIEGDLLVAGELMRAGDYCRAEPGSVHEGVSTIHGCVFIAVQSQRDEWLTA
ncbi:MAG: cupin domain-containing protein [Deltaproteobacteria bacterium]|nr:cupin domain-containing protein [Deltaproteobacteria bacterium]MBI3390131.1 cupin domain-containing protein [Deltaproteobacteria bacterium]